ncbi:serine-rich adhesin for platelets [Cucumis melo var. makuwa]|uniref:Serine-rich adhesin for platelets n=1 Tax=Cucumis melo var. makuwa TaxID=1194695 RepID=A0A5A7UIV0_CUCMM|nr:serine-rich adhesin for platelets [Cucumis melo var. makuwa]
MLGVLFESLLSVMASTEGIIHPSLEDLFARYELRTFWLGLLSKQLDERAQILLKRLLDDATSGVLEVVSKNLAANSNILYNFLHKDDKQTKPVDKKVVEWMKHNQTARKMENSKFEQNPIRDRASASNTAFNDLPHGIVSALRRIELHILSLQHCCTSQSKKTRGNCQCVLQRNETLNQQKVHSKTDHSTLRTGLTKPVNPIVTHRSSEFVHGLRIPRSQGNDEAIMKPPIIEAHIMPKQHKVVNPMTKSGCTSVGSKATFRPAMKLDETSKQVKKKNQSPYGHMVMGPTLLDHHPSRELRRERTHNNIHLPSQKESESSNSEFESAFSSSSSWTTQETTESETTESETVDNDDDSSSPSRSTQTHQDDSSTTDSKSSSTYSMKTFNIKHGEKESKQAVGPFKQLKNKLGVIFHHHHHHHHHHHNNHNFMWKQLGKIFNHKENRGSVVSKEDKYEKVKNRAVRSVCDKNQVRKFEALAEGLRSHVRSKAMKRKEFKGMKYGKKKKNGVKKLNWWRMFRNRRGVKLPNKGPMKIGYVNRYT